MAAPTQVYAGPAANSTTPKTIAGIACAAGDRLVVAAGSSSGSVTLTVSGGSGLTWTLVQAVTGVANSGCAYLWTTLVPTAQTVTVSVARGATSGSFTFGVMRWGPGTTIGASAKNNPTVDGLPTLGITTTSANSALAVCNLDWDGNSGATRAYATPTNTSAAAEASYILNSGVMTHYAWSHATTGAIGAKTVGMSAPAGQKFSICAVEIISAATGPTPVKIETCVDNFSASSINATLWPTRNGVSKDTTTGCCAISATFANGATQYAELRSAAAYTLLGSYVDFGLFDVPQAVGDTVNAQFWVMDPTGSPLRIGFEYIGATGMLQFVGQGAGYSPIGTTQSVKYTAMHRYLWISYDATNGIQWYTSPDHATWTLQRTLAPGSVPSWLSATNTLAISVQAFRTTGANDFLLVRSINYTPPTAIYPRWSANKASVGVVGWQADLTKADAVAAGYQDASWNRQTAAGNDGASGLPWPPVMVPAPYGRMGSRAAQLRVPDGAKRYEIMPNVAEWADGDGWWEGFAFCVGADTDITVTNYQTIWQLRPDDDRGSPPVSIEVLGSGLRVTGGYDRPTSASATAGSTYDYTQTVMTGLKTLTWYNLVFFCGIYSAVNSGQFDMWVNGVSVLSGFVPPPGMNYPYSGLKAYPKCGMYHDPSDRGATIWIAEHKIGTGYAAVDPTKAITDYRASEMQAFGR